MEMTQQELIEAIERFEEVEEIVELTMPEIELSNAETYQLFILNKMLRRDTIFKHFFMMFMVFWELCCHSGFERFNTFVTKAMINMRDLIVEIDEETKKGKEKV